MKIIEVTGISGAGKSFIINQMKLDTNYKFDDDFFKKKTLNFKLILYFLKANKAKHQFLIILHIAYLLDFDFFDKVNFIRNTVKKISKYYYLKNYNSSETIVVDEGVTHIYQNVISHNKTNKALFSLVTKLINLNKIDKGVAQIIIVDASNNIIRKRLISRGHRRIKDENSISSFIINSRASLEIIYLMFDVNIIYNN